MMTFVGSVRRAGLSIVQRVIELICLKGGKELNFFFSTDYFAEYLYKLGFQ